ncbi:MAG: sensor histidine kinase [Agriterribacter sp.]
MIVQRAAILFILIFICQFTSAQQSRVDSLRNNINKAPTDSLRVEALFSYMEATLNNNTADFEPYVKEMAQLSKKIHFKWGLATAYNLSLSYYKNKNEFETALGYGDSLEALVKNDTAENLVLQKAHMYSNRANLYYRLDDNTKAMEGYLEAEKIFSKIDHWGIVNAYNGVANCFMSLGNHPKSLEYSRKAVEAAQKFNDKRLLASMMMNQSTIFMNLKNYKAADSVLNIVWPVVEKLENNKSFYTYYLNRGDVEAYHTKDTLKALDYYRKAKYYARLNKDEWLEVSALMSLAGFQQDLKDKDFKATIDELYQLSVENGFDNYRSEALGLYSEWYNIIGDYKKAFEYQKMYKLLSDSLLSEETKENISMMEVRFRMEKKEQEINRLKADQEVQRLSIRQKNILNYVLAGSAAALLIISALTYRNYRQKQKLQQQRIAELETEKKLAATEAVLKGEEQERTRLAKDLHDGLGGMLSGIKYAFQTMKGNLVMTPDNHQAFERSMDMLDSSIKEMRRVAHNMMPEALVKFGLDTALKDFCNDINQSGVLQINYQSTGIENAVIDQTIAITIYRIVQELINNTIKHAGATTAILQVEKANGNITLTIEDDGKGFDPIILQQAKGIGWSNIQSRVEFLKGKLDVKSGEGKGTSVLIELKA